MLHPAVESITDVGTNLKGGVCVLYGDSTPSIDRVLCVYAPSGYSIRKQLARGRFLKGLQTYMENKIEGNENKIILGDFNYIVNKIDRCS